VCALPVLFWSSHGVAQQTSCPAIAFPQTIPQAREARIEELTRLKNLEGDCLMRADYYAYQGALLVSLGRGAQAIESLERALLLAPDMPGVQFDYAQALAQGGERKSAGALLQALLERDDLHPDFRGFLQKQQTQLLRPHWMFDFKATSLLGYESNLNSAPSARFYTFTPSSGDVVFELDSASRPKSGTAWLNSFSATGATELGAGEAIYVLADLRHRQSGGATDYLQAEGSVVWRAPKLQGLSAEGNHPNLRLGVSQLEFAGKTLFQGLRAEASLEFPVWSCQGRGGLARESRKFPASPSTDGTYLGILVSTHCLIGNDLVSFQINTGTDRPDYGVRAGGNQRRSELGFGWTRGFQGFETHLVGAYSIARDGQSYSPLIASGATRELNRTLVRAEIRVPMGQTWVWVISAETSRQSSNLDLFDIESRAVYAGIRARF
jgi:hypothetical protein